MISRFACFLIILGLTIFCHAEPFSSQFKIDIDTIKKLTHSNTSSITFEEEDENIIVSVVDKHGDGHRHLLILGSTSKEDAINLLKQKQTEVNAQ